MAAEVLEVTPKWSTSECGIEGDGKPGSLKRNNVLGFDILVSEVGLKPDQVRIQAYALGLPQYGSPHPSESYCVCRGVSVRQKTRLTYEGICRYEGLGSGGDHPDKNEQPKPPWKEAPKIRWSTISSEDDIDEDVDHKRIWIPETKEMISGLRARHSDPFVTINRFVPTFNSRSISDYIDHVSSDQFLGYPAGTAFVEQFEASSISDAFGNYWEWTVGVHFRRRPQQTDAHAWWKRVRNEGLYVVNDVVDEDTGKVSTNKIVRATDANHDPVVKPIPLKNGKPLADGQDAEWLEFQIYPTAALMPLVDLNF